MSGFFQSLVTRIAAIWSTLAASGGAALVGFIQNGANALANTVLAKLRQDYNAADWPTLDAALIDLGETPATLTISSAIPAFTANVTIPENITLRIKHGAVINQGAYTLTINGPFEAGWHQIFTGAGVVTFGPKSVNAVTPLWWNSNATPGTTDMITALRAALASMPTVGSSPVLELPPSSMLISEKWVIDTPVIVRGSGSLVGYTGESQTRILKAAAMTTAAIETTGANIHLRDFAVIGILGNTGDGIEIHSNGVTLSGVRSNRMGRDGIRIGSDIGVNANQWAMYSCITNDNGRHGVYCHDAGGPDCNAGTSINLTTQLNAGDGLNIGNSQVNTWVGTLAEFNTGWGCRVNPPVPTQTVQTFIGGDYEGNTAGQFKLDTTAFLNYVQVQSAVAGALVVDLGVENTIVIPGSITAPRVYGDTTSTAGSPYTGSPVKTVHRISNRHPNANNRNYALNLLTDSYGDFGLFQSAAAGGDAADATAIPKLFWDNIAGSGLRMTYGAPSNANGINGDICFRNDGGAGTTIYHKRAGVWVGIV